MLAYFLYEGGFGAVVDVLLLVLLLVVIVYLIRYFLPPRA